MVVFGGYTKPRREYGRPVGILLTVVRETRMFRADEI